MVALTSSKAFQVGEVAKIQPIMAPPGLELPDRTEVRAHTALETQNGALAQANAYLAAENALLMQQYMAYRLAMENAALRQTLQMGAAPAAALPEAALLRNSVHAKQTSHSSPISTAPPSDDDNDNDADDVQTEDEPTSPAHEADTSTTVLMQNVPRSFTRKLLMDLLDREGFCCKYTFLYLPFKFGSGTPVGYAFVDLESPQVCQEFLDHFHGFSAWGNGEERACCAERARDQQGLAANIERYRNSPVMHEIVPDACKPVILAHGARVAFPPPTTAIRLPRRLLAGSMVQRV